MSAYRMVNVCIRHTCLTECVRACVQLNRCARMPSISRSIHTYNILTLCDTTHKHSVLAVSLILPFLFLLHTLYSSPLHFTYINWRSEEQAYRVCAKQASYGRVHCGLSISRKCKLLVFGSKLVSLVIVMWVCIFVHHLVITLFYIHLSLSHSLFSFPSTSLFWY